MMNFLVFFWMQVTYETAGFLEKNRDTLRPDISKLLKKSENDIVRATFYTPLSRTGSLSAAPTVNKAPPSATPLFGRRAPMVSLVVPFCRKYAHIRALSGTLILY